jgi:hypothetical protein
VNPIVSPNPGSTLRCLRTMVASLRCSGVQVFGAYVRPLTG